MWPLRRLNMRWLQCALCFYLSTQICEAIPHQQQPQQQRDVSMGNLRLALIKIKRLLEDVRQRDY